MTCHHCGLTVRECVGYRLLAFAVIACGVWLIDAIAKLVAP